ncbi:MAG TPA: DUF1287 domain-containing protein [Pyrinomonadaceae bacterium]|jgi:uncharacterized protein YijF (DUF1287 family)|nr:DUF1287 domain-containing protein [Pyrinomonadaceae bacterium]
MNLKKLMLCLMLVSIAVSALACHHQGTAAQGSRAASAEHVRTLPMQGLPVVRQVVEAAIEQTHYTSRYDAAYAQLDYPGGDVPLDRGACTDVIVRAFRKGGVDLQQSVHEDMSRDFAAYPQTWGLPKPDSNIDHRRVPNLMTYFKREGKALPVTASGKDYLPGDVVTWDLNGLGLSHTGMVTNLWSDDTQNYLIVHNIGAGAKIENVLFAWHITGHYRYF